MIEAALRIHYTPAVTGDSLLRKHLAGVLLIVLLLVSLAFFLLFPPERANRTLFFPGTTELALRGERRLLPRGSDERAIEFFVQDQILGPAHIEHGRLLPRATEIQALLFRDGTVFLDLSSDVLVDSESVRIPLDQALDGLRHAILYNFRHVEDVLVTIDGSIPFVPSFRPQSIGN
jgi:hypothetical protein